MMGASPVQLSCKPPPRPVGATRIRQGQAMDSYAAQRSTGSRFLLAGLLTALVGCSQAPNAAKPSEDDNDAAVQGEQIAEKMLAAYRNAKSYTDHATYVQHSVYRGEG